MLVLVASIAASVSAPASAAAINTTLCAVVNRPSEFSGKVVRFRAGVLTDWHHGILLVHSGCKRGIELSSTNAAPAGQSKALDDAVGTPLDGGRGRTAMATFTGKFSVEGDGPNPAVRNTLKFDAHRIEDIRVYRRTMRN